MEKQFCDRCGKEIKTNFFFSFVNNFSISTLNSFCETKITLCKKCLKDFEIWLGEGQE